MHKLQLKLLELSARKDLSKMSLREIGHDIGVSHPQKVHYHMDQLKKGGHLLNKNRSQVLKVLRSQLLHSPESMVEIPILGAANCGLASLVAIENLDGYLKISKLLLLSKNYDHLFAVKAEGNSLNRASVKGEAIEDGDLVIVDTNSRSPRNGDYILSIIEGAANIKKYHNDGEKISLLSESAQNYPPIFIHPDDDYLINGTVVQVIKHPKGGDSYGK